MFELKPVVWIIAGLVLAALEMVVPGLVIIWFGIAGVVTGVIAFFVPNQYVQFVVFIVLSGAMVVLSQRIARRITKPEPEPVGANRMLSAEGRVIQAITPPEFGRVKVGGEEWRAQAKTSLAVGTVVKVTGVAGTHLLVESAAERSPK